MPQCRIINKIERLGKSFQVLAHNSISVHLVDMEVVATAVATALHEHHSRQRASNTWDLRRTIRVLTLLSMAVEEEEEEAKDLPGEKLTIPSQVQELGIILARMVHMEAEVVVHLIVEVRRN